MTIFVPMRQRHISLYPLVCLSILALIACSADQDYGTGLVPDDQFLNGTLVDTFEIKAQVVNDDTIRMDEAGVGILGQSYDPIFGKCNAGFYTNFSVASPVLSYGPNPKIDSVVLVLQYEDLYGNRTKLFGYQTVKVYELLEPIPDPPAEGFTNFNTNFAISNLPVGERGFAPIFPLQGTDGRLFRIRLDNSLGQRFLDAESLNNSNIEDILKGLYLSCEAPGQQPGEGALIKFNTQAAVSGVYVYYKTDNQANQLVRTTSSGNGNITINQSEYDRSTARSDLQNKLAQADFNYQNQPDLYIQPLQGLRIFVEIPHLLELKKLGNIVINRAELMVPIDLDASKDYPLPATLITYYPKANGDYGLFSDINGIGNTGVELFYDGIYRSSLGGYRFRITQHVQDLLAGDIGPDPGFYIDHSITGKNESFSRLVVRGPYDPETPMKLSIIYTLVD